VSDKEQNLEWVRHLAQTLKEHNLYTLSVETEDVSLTLKAKAVPQAAPAAPAETPTGEKDVEEADVELIRSQDVGIFRATVKLATGSIIKKGQKLGAVESVSLQHELVSDRSGTLLEILASDGDPVEYGQPLLVLSPEGAHV
jgi:acetyl-CoA carboxylase biotin carboxyl carrier protein